MSPFFKKMSTVLISLLFAGGLMYLVSLSLGGEFVDKTVSAIKRANYLWIVCSAFFGIMAYWIRAIRWNLLLEPMGYKIKDSNALWALSFGYFLNLGIPRMGEVGRATALQTVENVPFSNSFGTIVIERIIDLCFMVLFLLLAAIFNYSTLWSFFDLITGDNPKASQGNFYSLYFIVLGIILILFILIFIYRKKIIRLSLVKRILSIFKGIWEGLLSVFKLKQKLKFILLSLGIWICYFFAAYLIVFALPETSFIPIQTGFYILAVGTLGMLVPASGGIGAYHGAMMIGFSALFFSWGYSQKTGEEVGYSFAILSHGLQMIIMIVMGIISIFMLGKNKKRLKKSD